MIHLFKNKNSVQKDFNKWVGKMSDKGTDDLVAINFGISETEEGYRVYLIGSKQNDVRDGAWTGNEDYVPENKFFARGLNAINCEGALKEVEGLINDFLRSDSYTGSILADINHISCGIDKGHLSRVKVAV